MVVHSVAQWVDKMVVLMVATLAPQMAASSAESKAVHWGELTADPMVARLVDT